MADEAHGLNELTKRVIGAAIEIHRKLGPGLLESAYEACLYFELVTRGLKVERQKALPLVYEGVALDCAYRMDLVVEDSVIVEVKAVSKFDRVHEAQMDSYLRLSDLRVGLLLNFNVKVLSQTSALFACSAVERGLNRCSIGFRIVACSNRNRSPTR